MAKFPQASTIKAALIACLLTLAQFGSVSHAKIPLNYGWTAEEKKAITLYKQGDYQLAENVVEQMLTSCKPSHKARQLNLKGICLAKLGKTNEANRAFREAEKDFTKFFGHIEPHQRAISCCRLKIVCASAPEPVLYKRYPWLRINHDAIKADLIDLIICFCIVPDDEQQQCLG